MSFLKQLQQQTKDKNKIGLELFNDPKSKHSDVVLIIGEDKKPQYYKLNREGVDRTSKYYNVEELRNILIDIDDNHKGLEFLLKVQKMDFVPPDIKDNVTGLFFSNKDYRLTVDNIKITSLIKVKHNQLKIIEHKGFKYINIIRFVLSNRKQGYIYCNEKGYLVAKLINSDNISVLSKTNERDLVKHIGKVNIKDKEVENKNLVDKLKGCY